MPNVVQQPADTVPARLSYVYDCLASWLVPISPLLIALVIGLVLSQQVIGDVG
jgi:hypothetical protein